jgi:hypothetical protein
MYSIDAGRAPLTGLEDEADLGTNDGCYERNALYVIKTISRQIPWSLGQTRLDGGCLDLLVKGRDGFGAKVRESAASSGLSRSARGAAGQGVVDGDATQILMRAVLDPEFIGGIRSA